LYKQTYFILLSLGQGKGFKLPVQEQHKHHTKEAHANKTTEQTYAQAQQLAHSTNSLPREKNSSIFDRIFLILHLHSASSQ
jgi:hypothetical protein